MALTAEAFEGMKWTSAARIFTQLTNIVSIVALTRMLLPEDFGQLAMLAVITGFAALFAELGFSAALIQRKNLKEEHYSSVFWLNVATGFGLGSIVFLSAPWIANFYKEPSLVWLARAASITFVVAPLNMVQRALLTREMRFKKLAIVETTASASGNACALALAFSGFGVWSLVWKELAAASVSCVIMWSLSPWRPSRRFEWSAIRDLIGFSANLMGFSAINYWARKSDDLLIGRFMGASALGSYSRAYALMMLPLQEVTAVLGRVMYPVMARVQDDKPVIKRMYLQTLSYIALLTFPLMAGIFVVAARAVPFVYGPQWTETAPVLRVFCLVGMVQSLGTTVGWIYQSQGRTDWMLRWGLIASSVLIGGIVVGVLRGTPLDVAYGYATAMALLTYPLFAVPGRLIGLTTLDVARAVSGIAACTLVAATLTWGVGLLLPPLHDAVHLALQAAALMFSYWVLLVVFRVRAFGELLQLSKGQLPLAK